MSRYCLAASRFQSRRSSPPVARMPRSSPAASASPCPRLVVDLSHPSLPRLPSSVRRSHCARGCARRAPDPYHTFISLTHPSRRRLSGHLWHALGRRPRRWRRLVSRLVGSTSVQLATLRLVSKYVHLFTCVPPVVPCAHRGRSYRSKTAANRPEIRNFPRGGAVPPRHPPSPSHVRQLPVTLATAVSHPTSTSHYEIHQLDF